ncbi:DUF4412 domain-containing protein [Zunongwangia sp. F363]|uniref:DUF4412 domain-containing protein n=1 Tax=Autumnicola tepida TaxID=3075595 RepID=A0ABU3C8Z7_9FLAO|nr:DUF4412 domain-containing protein [Zunongwangia sp. F363]MDT0642810.1 DUF4412 domain-containing protein [Zunongwangia sp. F363]
MKKLLILNLGILFLFHFPAEAQIFRKLTKKVEEKVEDAVVKNVSDKAANETDKKLNQLWETDFKNASFPVGTEMVDPAEIPEIYSFDWEYTLNMKTAETDMEMTYFLKENSKYVGVQFPKAPQMFTVLDKGNNMTVMYLASDGRNFVTATKFPEPSGTMEGKNENADMEIQKIGKKTIQGYDCQGYRIENENSVFTFYVTDEAGISFNDIFQANQKKIPSGFDPEWLENGEGLMMQMEMENKDEPSKNTVITCTKIEESQFSISKSDYNAPAKD